MTEEKEDCNFQQNYNIFGLDDKPCCYLYHKYCNEIDSCYFKRFKRLEQENKQMKSVLEEIRTYLNTLSSIDNDFPNTETYLRIQNKINEVLNDDRE